MVSPNQMAKVARAQRDRRLKPDRSRVMALIIEALDKKDRNLSWLARKLKKSRQAVSAWDAVPEDHIEEVAKLTGLDKAKIS